MQKFTAFQLHQTPQKVFCQSHREPIIITHRSHGQFLLISETQLFRKHHNADGSVTLHVRGMPEGLRNPAA